MNKFLQIQEDLLKVSIKPSSFKVFCILLKYSKDGFCYPSYDEISKYGICEKTAKNSIKELQEHGLLLKQNRFIGAGKRTSNCYYVDEKYLVKRRKNRVEKPDWFDKDLKKEELNEKEKQELQELLKKF